MSKQTKITKSARGEDCQIRIPGVCNFNPETTVFCHINGAGMGIKASDLQGSYGCSACHDAVDGKTSLSAQGLKFWFYDGVFRTQLILLEKGLIKI